MPRMNVYPLGTALGLLLAVGLASAQGMLRGSVPSDGATVGAAPDAVTLSFAHPMRLTALRLSTLIGEVIPVEVDPNAGVSSAVSVPIPNLAPDDYLVEWQAVGDDGHAMSGQFSFAVSGDPKDDRESHGEGGDMRHGRNRHMDHDGHGEIDHGGHAAAHWNAPDAAQRQPNPVPVSAECLTRSRQIFRENCAVCHGATGAGDGPAAAGLDPRPVDLRVMAKHHPPGDLAWKITHGRNAMPGWGAIYDETTIWDLVNFLKHEIAGPPAVRATPSDGHDHDH